MIYLFLQGNDLLLSATPIARAIQDGLDIDRVADLLLQRLQINQSTLASFILVCAHDRDLLDFFQFLLCDVQL